MRSFSGKVAWQAPLLDLPKLSQTVIDDQNNSKEKVVAVASWLDEMSVNGEDVASRVDDLMRSPANEVSKKELKQASLLLRRKIREHDVVIAGALSRVGALLQWCEQTAEGRRCRECEQLQAQARRYRLLLTTKLAPSFEALRAVGGIMSYVFEIVRGIWDKNR
jgi:hypothetical protein